MKYSLYPELDAWLEKHHAKRIGRGQVGEQQHDLYMVNARLLIVATDGDSQVSDIFIPASILNDITATLKAVEVAFGIEVH